MPTKSPMQLGMVGLGRMGAGLVRRLMRDRHRCVGYDVSPKAVKALEASGADGADSLQAFAAEGLNIIRNANAGKRQRNADAETAPLEAPELYQYDIDTIDVAEVWRRGSVIGSWLLDLTAEALYAWPTLDQFADKLLSAMRKEFGGHDEKLV